MSDILTAVLEDMACDLGIVVQLPPPPTSPSVDSLSLAEPHSPSTTTPHTSPTPTPSRKRPLSPSSAHSLFTPPATPRTPLFLTPHSKRVRATSASSPLHSKSVASGQLTPVRAHLDLLRLSLTRRSPRLNTKSPQSLSQLLTSGAGWDRRVRSAACTPVRSHEPSQQPKQQPRPFLTPQPTSTRDAALAASSNAPSSLSERRRHSDGLRLSSKRYQAALSLHALPSTPAAAVSEYLEVPVASARRSPPASPSYGRDSTRSSKALFG